MQEATLLLSNAFEMGLSQKAKKAHFCPSSTFVHLRNIRNSDSVSKDTDVGNAISLSRDFLESFGLRVSNSRVALWPGFQVP
jgi:hypothetical protein